MSSPDRRSFMEQSLTGLAAAGLVSLARPSRATTPSGRLVMGAIGCGGQGTSLLKSFSAQPDVKLAYVCDPDESRAAKAAEVSGQSPKIVKDLREILDDKSVDAVTVGTPDHWHGPATLLALAAGKHVYVEKPCCHNLREGRLMVEAARKNNRVVQVGMQARSTGHVQKAIDLVREGAIGKILVAKAWNSQRRGTIGHAEPSDPPPGFDYDLWVGPAPMVPFQKNRHHYTWHWWYDFGSGDMGNDGVHELDIARWGLGVNTHPAYISGSGGKLFFEDDQQFPDTQYVVFEYPPEGEHGPRQLIFEMRIWSPYVQEEIENGVAFYGTEGMLIVGKQGGFKLYGRKNTLLDEYNGKPDSLAHHRNFLYSIQTGKKPNGDIEDGHLSAALCHLGNITARCRRSLRFDPAKEQFIEDSEANALVQRQYRQGHWAVPNGV